MNIVSIFYMSIIFEIHEKLFEKTSARSQGDVTNSLKMQINISSKSKIHRYGFGWFCSEEEKLIYQGMSLFFNSNCQFDTKFKCVYITISYYCSCIHQETKSWPLNNSYRFEKKTWCFSTPIQPFQLTMYFKIQWASGFNDAHMR